MTHREIDRLLSQDEGIEPSSGFVASVMDAVLRETKEPPPIPFPWGRALPGIVVGGMAFLAALALGAVIFAQLLQALPPGTLRRAFADVLDAASENRQTLVAIATLIVTVGSLMSAPPVLSEHSSSMRRSRRASV
jgi:hypothetical protein